MSRPILDITCIILAELIGTIFLVFFGCMGQIPEFGNSPIGSALAFGLTLMFVAQLFGVISGAHVNPAVTVAALVYGTIKIPMAIAYIGAQILGAILGFGLLVLVTPENFIYPTERLHPGVCSTVLREEVNIAQGFFIEFFLTAILVLLCCSVWDPRNATNKDGVSIKFGLVLTLIGIIGGPYTMASVNPARSIGPALWNGDWDNHWIYWIAPLASGAIISLIYRYLFWRPAPPEPHLITTSA